MAVGPTPKELAHWMCKEMQTIKKQANHTVPGYYYLKIKESTGSGFDAELGSFGWIGITSFLKNLY